MKSYIKKYIEYYINVRHKNNLEEYYGEGTTINVNSLTESIKNKIVLVDVTIKLKGEINIHTIDDSLVWVLVDEVFKYFGTDFTPKIISKWDV